MPAARGYTPPQASYQRFAKLYQARLGRDGVELEIRESGGSLENLERLRDQGSGVQAAFTTTGAALPGDAERIASLGGLFYSPIFVSQQAERFYRSGRPWLYAYTHRARLA